MIRHALSVTSECVPLVKTGGLADVAGALPAALAPHGWALRTLLPAYPAALARAVKPVEVWSEHDLFGGPGRVLATTVAGLDLLLLDASHLFARDGSIYLGPDGKDWPDNPERFAALSWAAAQIARGKLSDGWVPELVHAHDWQGGLVPTYLDGAVPTVLTIHNIAFHGLAPANRLTALRLPADQYNPAGFEFYDNISALKAGLTRATAITTVSPTYAQELTTPEYGKGLDGVIRDRVSDLSGVLNGIDMDVWSPATDPLIERYKTLRGKGKARAALRADFDLPEASGPLCIVVSRLTDQKGLDVLLGALPRLLARDGQLALLGSGDPALEAAYRDIATREANVSVRIGYDEALSHRMFAGADAVLVPSRFEPCGLTQMYGLRYGAVPLVARTGGLADTVVDANPAALRAGVATGVVFAPVTADALGMAIDRLCDLHAAGKPFEAMQRAGMRADVGWDASAAEYAGLYAKVAGQN